MDRTPDRFSAYVTLARDRSRKAFGIAVFIALLIAALLWQTQWPALRLGLQILLAGQVILALLLAFRSYALSRQLNQSDPVPFQTKQAWFDQETAFVQRSALWETTFRIIGFAVLAYGFWVSTRQLAVALVLGIVYPAIAYFGMSRKTTQNIVKGLKAQRSDFETLAD